MADDLNHPRWSRDSTHIAWLAARKGGNALLVTDARGGRRRIFQSDGRNVIAFPWSLAQQSPLDYVTQERTPLLLIVGLRDTRAPYVQAIEFYKALEENGAPVQMLADPRAGHGPDDPQGFVDWWSSTVAWFARYGGIPIADGKLP